jgi:hypothetical protein
MMWQARKSCNISMGVNLSSPEFPDTQTCPDMSLYTKTSDIQTCPDMSLYTKTSEILSMGVESSPEFPDTQTCPDMSLYTKTSEIPKNCPEITSNVTVVKLDSGEKVVTKNEAARMCEFINDQWVPTSNALDHCRILSTYNACSHGFQSNCNLSNATCKVYINPDLNTWGGSQNCGIKTPFCPTFHNETIRNHANNMAARDRCTVNLPDGAVSTAPSS